MKHTSEYMHLTFKIKGCSVKSKKMNDKSSLIELNSNLTNLRNSLVVQTARRCKRLCFPIHVHPKICSTYLSKLNVIFSLTIFQFLLRNL